MRSSDKLRVTNDTRHIKYLIFGLYSKALSRQSKVSQNSRVGKRISHGLDLFVHRICVNSFDPLERLRRKKRAQIRNPLFSFALSGGVLDRCVSYSDLLFVIIGSGCINCVAFIMFKSL